MAKKFGGMGMGGMAPGNMMKQIQKMQQDMAEAQQAIEEKEFTASVGGGVVSATVTGARKLVSVSLQPDVVDPEDVDMLQDLVVSAVNAALEQAENEMNTSMSRFTGGMSLPGLF